MVDDLLYAGIEIDLYKRVNRCTIKFTIRKYGDVWTVDAREVALLSPQIIPAQNFFYEMPMKNFLIMCENNTDLLRDFGDAYYYLSSADGEIIKKEQWNIRTSQTS